MPDQNALGIHALVWTGRWEAGSVRAACAGSAAAGYDLLEVPLLDPAEVDVAVTRGALDDAGLDATCSLGLDFDTDISATDTVVVQRGAELLASALDVAVRLGSTYLGGVIYSAMGKYRSPATAAGRANAVAVLRALADKARAHGVVLGLEPANRYESNLLNTVGQALDLIDDIGADNVVVHLDTYHANIEEHDPAAAVRQAAAEGRLGYVHVGESHRGYLGRGTVRWDPFFDALASVEYDGPVVFESFSSAVVSEQFVGSLGIWRDLWQDSAHLAAEANEFMRRHLTRAAREAGR